MRAEKRKRALVTPAPINPEIPATRILNPGVLEGKEKVVTVNFAHNVAADLLNVLVGFPVDPAAVARELLNMTFQDEA